MEESDHDQNEGDVERNAKGENGGDEVCGSVFIVIIVIRIAPLARLE